MQLLHGDCLELMKGIPDGSIDMILCDPPYGIDFQSKRRKNKEKWKPKVIGDKEGFTEFISEFRRIISPIPGIEKALKEIHDAEYEIAIVSTRCEEIGGITAIKNWLSKYDLYQYVDKVCREKPPAIVYIDDRAICFDGHPETLLAKINSFVPWYKKDE